MKKFLKILILFVASSIILTTASCSSDKDPVIMQCNGLDINKSTFTLLMLNQAAELYGEEGITEENILGKAKENALKAVREYTYFKQGCQEAGITLEQEERSMFRASVLVALMDSGLDYEASKRDKIFRDTFGVTFEQYMVFEEEDLLAGRFCEKDIAENDGLVVTEEEIRTYFSENIEKYGTFEIEAVLLSPDKGVLPEHVEQIKAMMKTEDGLSKVQEDFKKYIDKSGTFTVDSTSNLDMTYGEGLISRVINSSEGDVLVLESEKGISVTYIIKEVGYEEQKEDIENLLREERYEDFLLQKVSEEKYDPVILDQAEYDDISSIPGI